MKVSLQRRALACTAAVAVVVSGATWFGAPTSLASSTVVDDGFDRTVSAALGNGWLLNNGANDVQVDGSQVPFAGRPGSVLDAQLPTVTVADAQVVEKFTFAQLPASGYSMVGVSARHDAARGTGYRLWANVKPNGSASLHLSRLSPSGDHDLGQSVAVPDVVHAGSATSLQIEVTGTSPVTIKGTIWADGVAQPAAQFSVTDSADDRLQQPAGVGLALAMGATQTPVSVQHFTVTNPGDSAPVAPVAPATTAVPAKPTATPTTAAPAPVAPTTAAPKPTVTPTTTAPTVAPTTQAPAPATAAPAAVTRGVGSLPVGQASYPVPSGAIFVSLSGNDANPGTQSAPKRNLKAAVDAAPAGGTVVVRGGEYHQGEVGIFKPITVQAYPGEAVWFDGSSRVSNWTQSGSTWTAPWSTFFDHSVSFETGVYNDQFLDPKHPMAAWPDQVFVDGQQLTQVDASVTPRVGEFAVDQAKRRLVIGTNPAGHEVRASDLDRVFTVGSSDVTLRGFGVRRYANALPKMGVIYMARERDRVENVVVENVATLGISMTSNGKDGAGVIDHVTIRRAGLGGIDGMMFDNGKVTNSLIEQGNTQKFTPFPASAAIKVTRSKNVTFDGNVVRDNYNSTGIWTDESTIGATIVRNRVTNAANDAFAGIQCELTSNAIVADNVTSGTRRGIYLFGSNRLRVVNNSVWNSVVADISVDQDFRRQANRDHVGHDPRNPVPDPNNTWVAGDTQINNNLFGTDDGQTTRHFQFYVLDKDKAIPAGQMVTQATGNVFEAKDATSPTAIGWGKLDATVTQYTDITKWSNDVGRGGTNAFYPAHASAQQAADIAAGMGHGAPLDADIAGRIGQQAGSKHIGSFQKP